VSYGLFLQGSGFYQDIGDRLAQFETALPQVPENQSIEPAQLRFSPWARAPPGSNSPKDIRDLV
jgi:hypothetical protein